jgi:integrase
LRLPGWPKRRVIALVAAGEKLATRDRAAAERRRLALWRQWHTADVPEPAVPMLDALLTDFRRVNAAEASERQAAFNVRAVTAFLASADPRPTRPDEIAAGAIQAHLLRLTADGKAPQTVRHHRNALRKFCAFLVRRGDLDRNPAGRDRVSVPKVTRTAPRFLTVAQVGKLLRAVRADRQLYAAVVLALETGARLGELVALRPEDVKDGALVIGAAQPTKTGTWRSVPLSRRAARLVRRYGLPGWQKRWWVARLAKATANLPLFGELPGRRVGNQWHLLRSTWATSQAAGRTPFGRANDLGRPLTLWELMQRGGWTCPTTCMRYLSLAGAAG